MRWALSHYIDRQQMVDVAFLGASTMSSLPMPPYTPLLPYFDAVKDLLAKYDTLNSTRKRAMPAAGEGLQEAGGFWTVRTASRLR